MKKATKRAKPVKPARRARDRKPAAAPEPPRLTNAEMQELERKAVGN